MRFLKKHGRQILVYSIYIISLTVFQFALSGWLVPISYMPDLVLILVVVCGSFFGSDDGMIIGILAGFLRDMMVGRVLGLGMLLFMFAGLTASIFLKNSIRRNPLLTIIQVAAVSLIYEIVIVILTFLFPMLPDQVYSFDTLINLRYSDALRKILVNVVAAVPIMFLLHYAGPYRRGQQRTGMEDEGEGGHAWHKI